MRHPFQAIPANKRARVLAPLLIVTLVLMGTLNVIGAPLETEAAPLGIVSWELAAQVSTSDRVLDSWGPFRRTLAGFHLGLDYLFLILYSTTIAFACVWVTDAFQRRHLSLACVGLVLAWGVWLAATLDAIENVALAATLFTAPAVPWPQLAWACAVPKFVLVFLGLAYTLVGALWRLLASILSREC